MKGMNTTEQSLGRAVESELVHERKKLKTHETEPDPDGRWSSLNAELLSKIFGLSEPKNRKLGSKVEYAPSKICPRVVYSMVCKHWRTVSLEPGLQDHVSIAVPCSFRQAVWMERSLRSALKSLTLLGYKSRQAAKMLPLDHMIEIVAWKAPNLTFLNLPSCESSRFGELSLLSSLSNLQHLGLYGHKAARLQFLSTTKELEKACLPCLKELELEGFENDRMLRVPAEWHGQHQWSTLTRLKWVTSHNEKKTTRHLRHTSFLYHFLQHTPFLRYLHCDLAYITAKGVSRLPDVPILPDLSFLNHLKALMLWEGNCHLFEKVVQAEPLSLPSSLRALSFRTDWNQRVQPQMPLTLPCLPNLKKLSFGCHSVLEADSVLCDSNDWARNLSELSLKGLSNLDAMITSFGPQLVALKYLNLDRVVLYSLKSLSCLQSLERLFIEGHTMQQDKLDFYRWVWPDIFSLKCLTELKVWSSIAEGHNICIEFKRKKINGVFCFESERVCLKPRGLRHII